MAASRATSHHTFMKTQPTQHPTLALQSWKERPGSAWPLVPVSVQTGSGRTAASRKAGRAPPSFRAFFFFLSRSLWNISKMLDGKLTVGKQLAS